jgi:hypothetical protein
MTDEELDKARCDEAWRIYNDSIANKEYLTTSVIRIVARLARENWTPPEPVDPDVLAYREWELSKLGNAAYRETVLAGGWDRTPSAICFVAGFRAAREQEEEAAVALVEGIGKMRRIARDTLAAYEQGAQ